MTISSSAVNDVDYLAVTERGGEMVSPAQLKRFYQRYAWAGRFCQDKDVLEMACGTGPGLGYLKSISRNLVACDISGSVLQIAQQHYRGRIDIRKLDAVNTQLQDGSFDVVILFEAIYYIQDVGLLLKEVNRLLRPGGVFLLATANKDLFDFNPSPFSHAYYNPPELNRLFAGNGFGSAFFGGDPVAAISFKSKLIRFVKTIAVRFELIPGSMAGKRILKRLIFGPLVKMPAELSGGEVEFDEPVSISAECADTRHQVIYCVARKE